MSVEFDPKLTIDEVTRIFVEGSLKYHLNNKSATALSLGITTRTLYNWLERWNIKDQYVASVPNYSKQEVVDAWKTHDYDKTKTAIALRISRSTLYDYLFKYGLIETKAKAIIKSKAKLCVKDSTTTAE